MAQFYATPRINETSVFPRGPEIDSSTTALWPVEAIQMPSLRDLCIFVPGILGSRLEADGKPIWDSSYKVLFNVLTGRGTYLKRLDLAEDGVRATGLVKGLVVIPGLIKIDGYSQLTERFSTHFDNGKLGFQSFPYDWRKDIRHTANLLIDFARSTLTKWRLDTSHPDSRLILICHSMGGLIADHALRIDSGLRSSCRTLISIGTPYLGAPKSLHYLTAAQQPLLGNVRALVASFPSLASLLPTYGCVKVHDHLRAVTTVQLPQLAPLEGLIRESVAIMAQMGEPLAGVERVVYAGIGQETPQTISITSAGSACGFETPPEMAKWRPDGDGTVPYWSASPQDWNLGPAYQRSMPATHTGLCADRSLLADLVELVSNYQLHKPKPINQLVGIVSARLSGVPDVMVEGQYIRIDLTVGRPANLLSRPTISFRKTAGGNSEKPANYQLNHDSRRDLYFWEGSDVPRGVWEVEVAWQADTGRGSLRDGFLVIQSTK